MAKITDKQATEALKFLSKSVTNLVRDGIPHEAIDLALLDLLGLRLAAVQGTAQTLDAMYEAAMNVLRAHRDIAGMH